MQKQSKIWIAYVGRLWAHQSRGLSSPGSVSRGPSDFIGSPFQWEMLNKAWAKPKKIIFRVTRVPCSVGSSSVAGFVNVCWIPPPKPEKSWSLGTENLSESSLSCKPQSPLTPLCHSSSSPSTSSTCCEGHSRSSKSYQPTQMYVHEFRSSKYAN